MRGLLLLVIAMLLVGCSGNEPVPPDSHMSVSPKFSALEAEAAIDAADQWRTATGGVVDLTPSISDDGAIRLYPADGAIDDKTMGQTDSNGSIADIRINMLVVRAYAGQKHHSEVEWFHDTVMHELGHALGLPHLSSGLMVAEGYGGGCVDQVTLDVFCRKYSCPATAAPTCS